jgi:hypothetical protein
MRRLPDHVVPLMLRVLMTIPRTPDRRLVLRKPDEPRRPVHSYEKDADFTVLWRDRVVGRIWRFDYSRDGSAEWGRYLWHWHWRDVEGRPDTTGHAPTLESAMADFRQAWDGGTKADRTA